MNYLKKFESFSKSQNEGVNSWITAAMMLINIGFISAKSLNDHSYEIKKIVDTLNTKDRDSISIINDIIDESEENNLDNPINLVKFNTAYQIFNQSDKSNTFNRDFLTFLNYTNNNNFLLNPNIFLIDERGSQRIPLYNISIDISDIVTTNLIKYPNIIINVNINNNYYLGFDSNPSYTSLGIGVRFK